MRQLRPKGAFVVYFRSPLPHRFFPRNGQKEPKVRARPEYDQVTLLHSFMITPLVQVEGWKVVDLGMMGEALQAAQACGHSQLVLVEVGR